MRKPALLVSATLHALAILLLLIAAALAPHVLPEPPAIHIELTPRLTAPPPVRLAPGGSGSPRPALVREELAPARAPARVFLPPVAVRETVPKLVLRPALLEAPDMAVGVAVIGSPLGIAGDVGGLGEGVAGPGTGSGSGAGDGPGNGFGNGRAFAGRITRQPELLYKEEPEYSEAARKAHFQGIVKLRIEVGLDGRPTHIQVLESVGLGLDEKAIEAILKWRFRPAQADGRAVVAPALVEVGFHLL